MLCWLYYERASLCPSPYCYILKLVSGLAANEYNGRPTGTAFFITKNAGRRK